MTRIIEFAMNPDSWQDAMNQGINMEVPISDTESNAPPEVADAQPVEHPVEVIRFMKLVFLGSEEALN